MSTPEAKRAATITTEQIAADIADRHGLTKKQIEAVLDDLVAEAPRQCGAHFQGLERVRL